VVRLADFRRRRVPGFLQTQYRVRVGGGGHAAPAPRVPQHERHALWWNKVVVTTRLLSSSAVKIVYGMPIRPRHSHVRHRVSIARSRTPTRAFALARSQNSKRRLTDRLAVVLTRIVKTKK
jgi:hypothetical protein